MKMDCFLCIFLVVCATLAIFKIYFKLSTKWNGSYINLTGKTVIVTGANTGIGYWTALDFAMRGARVILACRSRDKAEDARKKIVKATGNENVVYKLIDMASLQSVRDFAENINKTEERLDILVNNAGTVIMDKDYTADGIQTILHVNHISPFLLTHLLMDKLKQSAPSRIVNVASLGAKYATLNISNLNNINKVPPTTNLARDFGLYCNSKLCNILFTTELAKIIYGTGVTTASLHPGTIYTEFYRGLTGVFKIVVFFIISYFFLSAEEAAQTQIYLSVSKDVDGINGVFFTNCRQIELYETAKDTLLAKRLWKKSEELAKMSDSEKFVH